MHHVSPDAIKDRIDNGDSLTILDVRDPHEYEENRLDPGNGTIINIPYKQHDDLAQMANHLPDIEKVYVICWTGVCSQRVAKALETEGYEAVSVDGGMRGM